MTVTELLEQVSAWSQRLGVDAHNYEVIVVVRPDEDFLDPDLPIYVEHLSQLGITRVDISAARLMLTAGATAVMAT